MLQLPATPVRPAERIAPHRSSRPRPLPRGRMDIAAPHRRRRSGHGPAPGTNPPYPSEPRSCRNSRPSVPRCRSDGLPPARDQSGATVPGAARAVAGDSTVLRFTQLRGRFRGQQRLSKGHGDAPPPPPPPAAHKPSFPTRTNRRMYSLGGGSRRSSVARSCSHVTVPSRKAMWTKGTSDSAPENTMATSPSMNIPR